MPITINGSTGITFPDGTTQTEGLPSPVPVADGGTGATTASAARTALGTNDAANITTGTLGTARLGSGTANSSTYLRGDQTWATVSGVTQTDLDNLASGTPPQPKIASKAFKNQTLQPTETNGFVWGNNQASVSNNRPFGGQDYPVTPNTWNGLRARVLAANGGSVVVFTEVVNATSSTRSYQLRILKNSTVVSLGNTVSLGNFQSTNLSATVTDLVFNDTVSGQVFLSFNVSQSELYLTVTGYAQDTGAGALLANAGLA